MIIFTIITLISCTEFFIGTTIPHIAFITILKFFITASNAIVATRRLCGNGAAAWVVMIYAKLTSSIRLTVQAFPNTIGGISHFTYAIAHFITMIIFTIITASSFRHC